MNEEQLKAVEAPLKPIIVIASAGTGKTKVLTERIVYLIEEKGISPDNILAITFTNLAAVEMKSRVQDRLKYKIPSAIGTIHSIFGEILRNGIEEICDDRNHSYDVLDDSEQELTLRRAFKDCGEIPPHPQKMGDIRKILSDWKTEQALNRGQFKLREVEMKYEKIFKKYEDLLREANNLDFDDVLLYSDLLLDKPKVQEHWRNKYQAILVDECQDLNELQWGLIKKLLPKGESFNFFAVGDPNQCIYLFNGAKENIFEEIKELFRDVEEINLVVNYRSDKSIVDLSGSLKRHKNVSVSHKLGEDKKIFSDLNLALEEISKDEKKGSWAVLFPRYSNADEIIERFIQENIPFRISEFRLLEDQRVDHIVKLLKTIFFDNSKPLSSLLWKKEFGLDSEIKKQLTSLDSVPKGTTLVEYLLEGDEWKEKVFFDIEGEEGKKVVAILEQIKQFRNKPKDNLSKLVRETYPFLFSELTPKEEKKINLFIKWLENIQEEFSEDSSRNILLNMRSLAEFSKREINEDQNEWVILSTIHKTKGLEWNNVIVLEYDKLLEEFNKDDSEDKHLAYVAVTRAKNKLFLIEKSAD